MKADIDNPEWWQYLARVLLALTTVVTCVCLYLIAWVEGFLGELSPFGGFVGIPLVLLLAFSLLLTLLYEFSGDRFDCRVST